MSKLIGNKTNGDCPSDDSNMDDWTLLSAPHSGESNSGSPDRQSSILQPLNNCETLPLNQSSISNQITSNQIEEDGLSEIDLNEGTTGRQKLENLQENRDNYNEEERRPSSSELSMSGFQPVEDLSTDTDNEVEQGCNNREASSSELELNDYIDFGEKNSTNQTDEDNVSIVTEADGESSSFESYRITKQDCTSSRKSKSLITFDLGDTVVGNTSAVKLSSVRRRLKQRQQKLQRQAMIGNLSELGQTHKQKSGSKYLGAHIIVSVSLCLAYIIICIPDIISHYRDRVGTTTTKTPLTSDVTSNDWSKIFDMSRLDDIIGDVPTNQKQIIELQLLHNELSQCIKRQSPTSFKYYLSSEDERNNKESTDLPSKLSRTSSKPIKGLICYGQEAQWRKRFERLSDDYKLDLSKLLTDAKRHITNEMLRHYHPSLKFNLIVNQIEYLNFLQNRREKKLSEETIRHLRGENFQLLRRLNQPSEIGQQRLIVDLELKNSKLARENEALKGKLAQKVGPTFVKQTIEMERIERENELLKKFHYQIAQDVSKTLKQFNLHTVDASIILDDLESLKSQIATTQSYFRRLKEKISSLLLENMSLKDELRDDHLLTTSLSLDNSVKNSPVSTNSFNLDQYFEKNINANLNNNGLIADNCKRNLAELRERSNYLEQEVFRLRRDCDKSSNELEKSFGHHLNTTTNCNNQDCSNRMQQIASNLIYETAVDKPAEKESHLIGNGEDLEQLVLYLTEFLRQVESDQLSVVDSNNKPINQKITKVLPNYLQEIIQVKSKNLKADSMQTDDTIKTKLPTAPTRFHVSADTSEACSLVIPTENLIMANPDIVLDKKQISNKTDDIEHNLNQSNVTMKDSWFFKRAKQRKQLRHDQPNGNKLKASDWAIRRAKLREKLRIANYHYQFDKSLKNNYRMKKKDYDSKKRKNKRNNVKFEYTAWWPFNIY